MQKELFKTLKYNNIQEILSMQILNINQDSFSGDGITNDKEVEEKVRKAFCDNVSIIDIGSQSTRPGSIKISQDLELKSILRTIRIIKKVQEKTPDKKMFISVDTFDAKIAEACIKSGADIINDISGGSFDKNMFEIISKNPEVYYVLSHIKGNFNAMHKKYEYLDIILELINYFEDKINYMLSIGIKKEQIILDVGFGFSKRSEENIEIIQNIKLITDQFDIPMLIGVSRKKFLQDLLNNNSENKSETKYSKENLNKKLAIDVNKELDIRTFLVEQIIIDKLENKKIIFRNHENKYLLGYLKLKLELDLVENISYGLTQNNIKELLDKDNGVTVLDLKLNKEITEQETFNKKENFLKAVKREVNYDMQKSPTIGVVYQNFFQKSVFKDKDLILGFKTVLKRDILKALQDNGINIENNFDDIILQHYKHYENESDYAIPPHQDQKGFVGVVAVLLVSGDSNFYTAKNREGIGERKIEANPGDIILMRGYDFTENIGVKLERPIHYIKKLEPSKERVSLGFRQYTKDKVEYEKLIDSYK